MEIEIQIWLSRFCKATQVMTLQHEVSDKESFELLSGQGSQDRQNPQLQPPALY